jgi:hypothetical protein
MKKEVEFVSISFKLVNSMKYVFISFVISMLFSCSPGIIVKSNFDACASKTAVVAVEPIKPGLFIEENLLKDLDSALVLYMQSKCSNTQVLSTQADRKGKFSIKLKLNRSDSLTFSFPDTISKDGTIANCVVTVTNLQVSSKSKAYGIPVGAIPTPIGFVVVGVKTNPIPISLDYSYDFAIWNYDTKDVLRYGTIKDRIPIYKINDNQYSLKENANLFFRNLLPE